ncbi:Endonuclease/exonuclease/phosphatase, partial [Mycena filopes]
SRKTRAHLKLGAININGRLKDSISHPEHKWHGLNRMMFDEQIGICVVGETHLSTEQADEIQDDYILGRRMDIYHSPNPDNPSTRGLAVVLNRELTNTQGVKTYYLKPGRAILAVVPWHGRRTHTVLGVYAPAESMEENKAFWDDLVDMWMTMDLPVPDSICGDMNLGEEPIDRFPHRADNAAAVAAFTRLKRLLGLQDGWRTVNPDAKEYTYCSPHGTLSRLDRILVSPGLFKNCREWEISDAAGGLTDHRLVTVQFKAPGAPYIGKGRYTIPLFLLRDKTFMDFTTKLGSELEGQLADTPEDTEKIQTRFKSFKEQVRDFAHARAKNSAEIPIEPEPPPHDESSQDSREDDILENGSVEDLTPAEKAVLIQKTIDNIVDRQREQRRTDTRIRCHTDLDRITKFSVRMSKEKKPRDTLDYLRRTDTIPAVGSKRSDEMAEIARSYHNDLQADASESCPTTKSAAISDVLEGMSSHEDDPRMMELGKILTEDDVLLAMKQSSSGTAAGIDGIPTELWKKLNELHLENERKNKTDDVPTPSFNVVKVLTLIYNSMEKGEVVCGTGFATGWMCPIWKKKDPTDIANY